MNSDFTIGIYGLASQSGRAFFADLLSRGYTVVGYNRPSPHGHRVLDSIREAGGIHLERPANSNHEASRFLPLKKGDAVTDSVFELVDKSDIIIIALPSIYHVEAAEELCKANIWRLRTPIVLSPSRSMASPYLWKILGKRYPIACFSTCPYSCKAPADNVSLIKRRKRTWVTSLEGEFSVAQIALLKELFPQSAITRIPALTSLNNIGAVFHCATYMLNLPEIERRKSLNEPFSFYMEGIAQRPEVGEILEKIDQIRLSIADRLGLSVFGLQGNDREDVWRKLINGLRALESENENEIDILRKIRGLFVEYLNNSVISAQHWLDITYGVERIEGETLSQTIARTPTYQKNSVPQFRYVEEDIPTGLVAFEALAKMFDIPCEVISEIIDSYDRNFNTDSRAKGRNLLGMDSREVRRYLLNEADNEH